jgi:hypothetical protein
MIPVCGAKDVRIRGLIAGCGSLRNPSFSARSGSAFALQHFSFSAFFAEVLTG